MSYNNPHDDASRPWCPPVDVYRAGDHYLVKADLPGLESDAITVTVKGNTLAISGCRAFEPGEAAEEHLRLERLHGNFICELHLPGIEDKPHMEVGYKDGVLQVEIPIK